MAMALPLLPAERIVDGFNSIADFARTTGLQNTMDRFIQYIRRVWIEDIVLQLQ